MMKNSFFSSKYLIIFFAFFSIFAFRLGYANFQNNFGQDLARDIVLTEKDVSEGKYIVAYGPKASVGNFVLFPAYYQIEHILAFFTGNHHETMRFFVLILESFTPILLFFILKELQFEKKMSILLALFFTISPLVTMFASFAWNPNTIPFLSTLALYLVIRYLKYQEKWTLVFIPFLYCLAFQFHLQAVILFLFFFFFQLFVFLKHPKDYRYLLLGVFLSLLTALPYIIYEWQNDWPNTLSMFRYFSTEHSQYFDRVSKPAFILTFLPAFFERVMTNNKLPWHFLGRIIFLLPLLILFRVFLKDLFYFLSKKRPFSLDSLIFLYFISLLIMLRVYKGDKIDYYMSTLFILPPLFFAYLSRWKRFFSMVLLAFAVFYAGQYYGRLEKVDRFAELEIITNFVAEKSQGKPIQLLFYNYEDINTFLYFFQKDERINLDQKSSLLLELCPKTTNCQLLNLQCREKRTVTYANLLKENGYITKDYFVGNSGYKVILGELAEPIQKPDYRLYDYNFTYGSDLLESNFTKDLENSVESRE